MNIPLFKIYTDDSDIAAISEVLLRGNSWAIGPEIAQFESKVSEFIGSKYTVAFNSGTSALHALMIASGIGAGDEVIVPSFSFIATANAPLFTDATPVFADIEDETCGLDASDVERKISSKTKAIILVHYGGYPARDTLKIKKLAQKHNLQFFEDVAEAFGAKIGSQNVGTNSDAAILSFCQNKVITTGEGGAVITNSLELYQQLKLVCSQGRNDKNNYFTSTDTPDYVMLGYNWRMPSAIAALGVAQVNKASQIIPMRQTKALKMLEILGNLSNIHGIMTLPDTTAVYQLLTIFTTSERDELQSYLLSQGIHTKVYFDPIHLTRFYKEKYNFTDGSLPVTEYVSKQVLSIPLYPHITQEEQQYIAEKIYEFYKRG